LGNTNFDLPQPFTSPSPIGQATQPIALITLTLLELQSVIVYLEQHRLCFLMLQSLSPYDGLRYNGCEKSRGRWNAMKRLSSVVACVMMFYMVGVSLAELEVPSLFSDHMVLQRGMQISIWGKATPNDKITVKLSPEQSAQATGKQIEVQCKASEDGRWKATLPPMEAGGPYELIITAGDNSKLTFHDVVIGDVWVCSGQSNMEWSVAGSANAEQEIANANYPLIRLFMVRKVVSDTPVEDPQSKWMVCSPETVRNFSAVGYFFARELHNHLKVPIGMIQAAWGGTPAESWVSYQALESDPELKVILENWQKIVNAYPEALKKYEERLKKWEEEAKLAKEQGQPIPPKPRPPIGPGNPWQPCGLFNGMIAPLTKFAI
jgi:sialate O-acetylesterase